MMQSLGPGWLQQTPRIGTMLTIASGETAEVIAGCGFDWLFLDGEHGSLETADLRQMIQAVSGRCHCLVRIPALSAVPIAKALDLGAAGIIVPQVNTAEQATRAVAYCNYPPQGTRGIGLARAHGYGATFDEYVGTANDQVLTVIQVEHIDAVENLESIVSVPGIDCIFVGPYDLSASLGLTGQVDAPPVTEAIARVEQICRGRQMPLGVFGIDADAVAPYLERGYQLICAGIDSVLLRSAALRMVRQLSP